LIGLSGIGRGDGRIGFLHHRRSRAFQGLHSPLLRGVHSSPLPLHITRKVLFSSRYHHC
jgi:hypothetical protein